MYILCATTVVFAAMTLLLFINNRTRAVSVPTHAYVERNRVDESKKAVNQGAKAGKKSVKKVK